jgi:isocitrate dehydrogenase
MNLVVIRENEEDLYAGIEHRQTQEVTQVLKLISRPGSSASFATPSSTPAPTAARSHLHDQGQHHEARGRALRSLFHEIARSIPSIETRAPDHRHRRSAHGGSPERFDVVVTPNLYGDILSDIAAQVAGSVGPGRLRQHR